MTKADLIALLAKQGRVTKKKAGQILQAAFEAIANGVKQDGTFRYPGFGTFLMRKMKPRRIINPGTKEPMRLPAIKTVRFRASGELKKLVRK